jgi:hypothetical protein
MLWVDPTDPEVLAAVAGPGVDDTDAETQAAVTQAVGIAGEILTFATAFLIHPSGEAVEESTTRHLRRLTPTYGPIKEVVSLTRVHPDGSETPLRCRKVGNSVQVHDLYGTEGSLPLWRVNWSGMGEMRPPHLYRLTYSFFSTVTPAARAMLLHYAHEFYLWLTGEDDDCQLPENVTSIDREGLGIQLATPQDFLDKGRTGLAKIDTWLSQVNAVRALRPSGVYTPDAPPGVGVSMRRLP